MTTTQLPPAPGQPQQPGAQQPTQQSQGLPPTGLQQQLTSLNQFYGKVQGAKSGGPFGGSIGYNVRQQEFLDAQNSGNNELGQDQQEIGSNSLDSMARNLAQRYGLPIGRGRLVDDYGNFLMTPQQLSDASGGSVTLGEAAAQMNYIGQALANRQNEEQQQKGIAALQQGMGQVQSRGRGSLASMMTGYYQDISDLYSNKEYEAADFSYYIQKEQLDIEAQLQHRAESLAKKQARGQFVAGIGVTIASLYTGNVAGVAAGASMVAGSYSSTGWF